MRVLIIEDEVKTVTFLQHALEENGWTVDVALDGQEGLHQALRREYALILLDVLLPRWDGWTVLAKLRASGRQTPVFFLTARDTVGDRVRGLDAGAEDYLVKPFALPELMARIRRIRRGGREQTPVRLRVADLEVDLLNCVVQRGGTPIHLTPKEYTLLALLARNRGEVLGRKQITEQVWGMELGMESNVVEVAVRRLRRKIDAPFDRDLIHSVYGVGYVLEER